MKKIFGTVLRVFWLQVIAFEWFMNRKRVAYKAQKNCAGTVFSDREEHDTDKVRIAHGGEISMEFEVLSAAEVESTTRDCHALPTAATRCQFLKKKSLPVFAVSAESPLHYPQVTEKGEPPESGSPGKETAPQAEGPW